MSDTDKTIRVFNPRNQDFAWRQVTFHAMQHTQISHLLFDQLLRETERYGSGGLEYDVEELNRLRYESKQANFAEFEALGIAVVATSVKGGLLSKGDKHGHALEWLESKKESRERWKMFWTAARVIVAIIGLMVAIIYRDNLGP